jgi:HPt (histidine-containing phosphotransfer) domain-containing protein
VARTDQPVDLNHLDRYTGGDRATNEEILRLFDDQCSQILTKLDGLGESEADAKSWREMTHTLKGAARGIGAFDLGDAVAAAETAGPDAVEALSRLKRDAAAVRDFIADFLKTPD